MKDAISIESKIRINGDVVSRRVQDEEVLLDLNSGTYYGLNEVGTRAWELFKNNVTLKKVVQIITEEYEIESAQAKTDLMDLALALKKNGLVEIKIS